MNRERRRKDPEDHKERKKKKDFQPRREVKDILREWERKDWENLTSDTLEGDNNVTRDDEE